MRRNTITVIDLVIVICVIVVVINIKSFKIPIPESKINYVSKLTGALEKQIVIVNDYTELTNKITSGEIPTEEAIYKLKKIRVSLIENKKEIENIIPPTVYANLHRGVINALQFCIESVETFLSALNIKDGQLKEEKIKDAKSKLKDYKKGMYNIRHPVCPELK